MQKWKDRDDPFLQQLNGKYSYTLFTMWFSTVFPKLLNIYTVTTAIRSLINTSVRVLDLNHRIGKLASILSYRSKKEQASRSGKRGIVQCLFCYHSYHPIATTNSATAPLKLYNTNNHHNPTQYTCNVVENCLLCIYLHISSPRHLHQKGKKSILGALSIVHLFFPHQFSLLYQKI